jgi:CDP-paratose 2-epimerase
VLDYARTYQLPTVAFHMSCIYGPHQLGTEDQGWVAHFLIKALENSPITIYGDGRQVRDILFVEDLIEAFLLAHRHIGSIAGQAFNIGGGPRNTISLLELIDLMATLRGKPPEVQFSAWRSADQKYYVSDTRKFSEATGWQQKVGVREGIMRLHNWLRESRPAMAFTPRLNTSATNGNGHDRIDHLQNTASPRLRSSCRGARHGKLAATNGK